MTIEALRLAREELHRVKAICLREVGIGLCNEVVLAKIDQAIAEAAKQEQGEPVTADEKLARMKSELAYMRGQQEQGEPVAWMRTSGRGSPVVSTEYLKAFPEMIGYFDLPLYTTPQQRTWVGLTDDQKQNLIGGYFAEDWAQKAAEGLLHDYEAKLKEKQ